MIPFNQNVKTLEDVQKEYPVVFDFSFLNRPEVQNFTIEELNKLVEDELDTAKFYNEKPLSKRELRKRFYPIAQAKALYHWLWSIDHITDQMVKWGWKTKDMLSLINKVQKAGYDPYSISEDTVGRYIEQLPGHGYKTVKTCKGEEFTVYNPRGYEAKYTETEDATDEMY